MARLPVTAAYPRLQQKFYEQCGLRWSGSRPIHVVAADDAPAQETIIVTVYQPDIQEWESGFKRRKRQ